MKKTSSIIIILLVSSGMLQISLLAQRQNPVTGAEARLESWKTHVQMKANSTYKDLQWRAVGPEQQGGRIETIACHPDEPYTIYVGAGSGGLWKTTNHGTTWSPIFDDQPTFAMGSMAIAPSEPDVLWLGTGEVLMARSSYSGLGIFKSLDAGESWQHMGLADSYHIPKIVIDPKDPNTVYAAALGHNYSYNEERGVFKTTDGGESWTKSLYISERVGVVDIVMDPNDAQTLYAVTWERERKAWNNIIAGKGSGIYKTTDGGENWERLTNGLPSNEHVGRIGLSIAPSNPNVIYAIMDNQSPGSTQQRGRIGGELYRSNDKGKSWSKTHEGPFITGIGYDFCLVHVSPVNEDELFVPGWKLVHSTDGGKTFDYTGETIVHLLPNDIRGMHLDMHEFWIDPKNPDRLLLGNDGGFYVSWDHGANWLHYNNLPIAEFYAISVDNDEPYNIYGGTQDCAALVGPGTHDIKDRLTKYGVEDPWKHIYLDPWGGGDSYFTVRDPGNPDIIYYEHQFGAFKRKNMKTGKTVSIKPRAPSGEPPYSYNWMTPFIISKFDPSTIYYGGNMMFKSLNRGDKWDIISPDLSTQPGPERQGNVPFGTITSISESSHAQGHLLIGTDDGNLQYTADDGKNWSQIDGSLPEKWVSRVRISGHDPNTFYVTFTGYRDDDFQTYIYKSVDQGESWISISGNLPPEPVNVITEDPRDKNILYIGTDLGAYVTLDGGKKWHSLSNSMPSCAVHDLVIQERELDLVAGTHGRSAFVLDIKKIKR